MGKEVNGGLEVLRLQAGLCQSLSDPKRLQIIKELRSGERTVSEIAGLLGLKQSNTSQHLGVLRRTGVIIPRRAGSTIYYRLADARIAEACDLVHEVIAAQVQDRQRLSGIMQSVNKKAKAGQSNE